MIMIMTMVMVMIKKDLYRAVFIKTFTLHLEKKIIHNTSAKNVMRIDQRKPFSNEKNRK